MTAPYLTIFILLSVFMLGYILWLKKRHDDTVRILQQKQSINIKELNTEDKKQKEHKNTAAKTRYLSGISHELRTPLNVIMGYAQLLENQALDDDPNRDKFTLIRHNCEHLNHLIEGILEFSAIEAGKLKVQFEVIDLHDLINQISAMYQHQAQMKGLTFDFHVDQKLPASVKTDHKRLQQILLNLLNNAIKFTDEGSVAFNVTYRNQVAAFTIKDSGRGIKKDDLERIFEPFERIEHVDKPIKGTGLGLPITRLLVELMGGDLSVKSTVNEGSEFIVKMMLAPLATNSQTNNKSQLKTLSTYNNKLNQDKHILVVDDEQSHRHLIVDILQQHEFQLSTAADAESVKEIPANTEISLAIIDVSMPVTNGWELAQWFKTNRPKTKVLMLSANPRDTQSNSAHLYDAYLTKPVKIKQLLNIINTLLELNWEQTYTSDQANTPTAQVTLSNEHEDALHNMLEIGHIKGIQTYLQKLAAEGHITEQQHKQLEKPLNDMNLETFKLMIDP